MFDSDFPWHESWWQSWGGRRRLCPVQLTTWPLPGWQTSTEPTQAARCVMEESLFWFMPNRTGSVCSEHWVPSTPVRRQKTRSKRLVPVKTLFMGRTSTRASVSVGVPSPQVSQVGETARCAAVMLSSRCVLLAVQVTCWFLYILVVHERQVMLSKSISECSHMY